MSHAGASPWLALGREVRDALTLVVQRARTPPERVARHWEDASRLVWFGVCADHARLHVSWSFGRLRGATSPARATVGVFQVSQATFAGVDEARLREALAAVVPPEADGATRVFLMRAAAQLAAGEALLHLAPAASLSLFVRPDAPGVDALPPRWPAHAAARVALALSRSDARFVAALEAALQSTEPTLLGALRTSAHP